MSSTTSKYSGLESIFCPLVAPGSRRFTLHEGRAYFTLSVPLSVLAIYAREHTPARHAYTSETVFAFAYGPNDPMIPGLKKRGIAVYDCSYVEQCVRRRVILPMAGFMIHDEPAQEDRPVESFRTAGRSKMKFARPSIASPGITCPISSCRSTRRISHPTHIAPKGAQREHSTPTKAACRAVGPYASFFSPISAGTSAFSSPLSSSTSLASLASISSSSTRYDKFNCAPLCAIEPARWCATRSLGKELDSGKRDERPTFDYGDVFMKLKTCGARGRRGDR